MHPRSRGAYALLALVDLMAGAFLVGWPGAWQEALHPEVPGGIFYPLQFTGAVWMARGALTIWVAARRPAARALVGAAWGIEAPAELLLAARTLGAGPWALPFHLGRATLAAAVALWSLRRPTHDPAAGSR